MLSSSWVDVEEFVKNSSVEEEEDDEDSSKWDFSFIWRWAANTWWFVGVGVVSFSAGGVDGERQLISTN